MCRLLTWCIGVDRTEWIEDNLWLVKNLHPLQVDQCWPLCSHVKGGYLDFSHLTELRNIYITEIYMKKLYKSSRIKNHKITKKKKFFDGVPLKGYLAS